LMTSSLYPKNERQQSINDFRTCIFENNGVCKYIYA
jgi:hypothetical protein